TAHRVPGRLGREGRVRRRRLPRRTHGPAGARRHRLHPGIRSVAVDHEGPCARHRVGHPRRAPGPRGRGTRQRGVVTFETEERPAPWDSVPAQLAKHPASAAVRRAITTDSGYVDELCTMPVEQVGVAGLGVPGAYDGVVASWLEIHVVLE